MEWNLVDIKYKKNEIPTENVSFVVKMLLDMHIILFCDVQDPPNL